MSRLPGNADAVRAIARPISEEEDYGEIVQRVGQASVVLMGEASNGIHDFYERRAGVTKRLIEEKGFRVLALEADWPDALRVIAMCRGKAMTRMRRLR